MYKYRVFSEAHSLSVHIKYEGKHIAASPYQLGPVMHEDCVCPLRNPSQWLEDFHCPAIQPQIANDLREFKSRGVNVSELYDIATKMFSRSSLVHYSIINGKVCHNYIV